MLSRVVWWLNLNLSIARSTTIVLYFISSATGLVVCNVANVSIIYICIIIIILDLVHEY